jgi:serine/threonine-protein kinase RsbW
LGKNEEMLPSDDPDVPPELILRLDVASTPRGVSMVRGAIVGLLRSAEVPDAAIDDIELVTAEACGNAVRHGTGERYSVAVDLDDDHCELEVVTDGDLLGAPPAAEEDPLAESGRGCQVMEALTDEFALESDGESSTLHTAKRWASEA